MKSIDKFKKDNVQYLTVINGASAGTKQAVQEGGKIYISISKLGASKSLSTKITGIKSGLRVVDASFLVATAVTGNVTIVDTAGSTIAKIATNLTNTKVNSLNRAASLMTTKTVLGDTIYITGVATHKGTLVIDVMAI